MWEFLCFILCCPGLLLVGTREVRVAPSASLHLSKGSRAAPVQCDRKVGASSPFFLVTWVNASPGLMIGLTGPVHLAAESCPAAPMPDPCHGGALVSQTPQKRTLQTSPPIVGSFFFLFPSFLCNLLC